MRNQKVYLGVFVSVLSLAALSGCGKTDQYFSKSDASLASLDASRLDSQLSPVSSSQPPASSFSDPNSIDGLLPSSVVSSPLPSSPPVNDGGSVVDVGQDGGAPVAINNPAPVPSPEVSSAPMPAPAESPVSGPVAGNDPAPAPAPAPAPMGPVASNGPSGDMPSVQAPENEEDDGINLIIERNRCGNQNGKDHKIMICHMQKVTLCVDIHGAVNGHEVNLAGGVSGRHGDYVGKCGSPDPGLGQ